MPDLIQLLEAAQTDVQAHKNRLAELDAEREAVKTRLIESETIEKWLAHQRDAGHRGAADTNGIAHNERSRTDKSRKPKTAGDAIKAIVDAAPNREFTTASFFDELKRQGVQVKRASIKSVAQRLVEAGFLDKLKVGSGGDLPVFKKKQNH